MSSTAPCGRFEIDVVEIEADALLEAGDRVLLADAADEGGQGRVGAARGFERDVGRGVADVGDVDRALALELLAGICGDGDRHVLQRFFAAARGDDDVAACLACSAGVGFRCRRLGGGGLGGRLLGASGPTRASRRARSRLRRPSSMARASNSSTVHCYSPHSGAIPDRKSRLRESS